MTQEPARPDKTPTVRKPLWRRILKWTIRVIIAVLVLASVAWAIFNYTSAKALQKEITKIQAAGQPLTFSQLDQSQPEVNEADDAAPYYKAAMSLRRISTDDKVRDLLSELTRLGETKAEVPHQVAAEVKSVLADNALALEMMDRGAKRPHCAYDFGLSNGIAVVLPQLSQLRSLARLLCLRTRWLAQQGNADAAADSLVSSLQMLRLFDRQPILVTYLAKVGLTAICQEPVSAVLEAGPVSDQQLVTMELALAKVDPTRNMQQVFIGERVYMLEISRNLVSPRRQLALGDAPALPEAFPMRGSLLGRPFLRMMTARTLPTHEQYARAAGKDWPDAFEAMKAASHRSSGMFSHFGQLLAPSFGRAMVLAGRVSGAVRSARVAVLAKRHHLANGRTPKSLEELREFAGCNLPTDPFTGSDLVYKAQTGGFMVYSVGDDLTDDGGPSGKPYKDWGVRIRLRRSPTPRSQPG